MKEDKGEDENLLDKFGGKWSIKIENQFRKEDREHERAPNKSVLTMSLSV